MEELINWLMQGEPWVKYRTQLDILGLPESDKAVRHEREQMLHHPKIQSIIAELSDLLTKPLTSHKSAQHPIHKLSFIADIGLSMVDEPIKQITAQILEHQSDEGAFKVLMNIPKHFGGSGENQFAWALCDAPLLLYSLIKFGLLHNPQIVKSIGFLTGTIQESGYPCRVSNELGKFRGPGKKSDPCPYANLLMLKVFSLIDDKKNSPECQVALTTQLDLWRNSSEKHPYMFFAGTDFRKLKAPFIWYDLLHVLDVLSSFETVKNDNAFVEMISLLQVKANEKHQFTPESIWQSWSDFDFGQKKQPSRWLTLLALRILKRVDKLPQI